VLEAHEIAIEEKATAMVTYKNLKAIRAFKEEYQVKAIFVLDPFTSFR
jgi:heme oxygenase